MTSRIGRQLGEHDEGNDLDTTAMALTALAAYRADHQDAADAITGPFYLKDQRLPGGAIGTTAETSARALRSP